MSEVGCGDCVFEFERCSGDVFSYWSDIVWISNGIVINVLGKVCNSSEPGWLESFDGWYRCFRDVGRPRWASIGYDGMNIRFV